jgi:excisionase family DNA binding protein
METTLRALTPEQAAEVLQVSTRTVYRCMRTGRLPAVKVMGQWRIAEQALAEFLRGQVPAPPERPAAWQRGGSTRPKRAVKRGEKG